MTALMEAFGVRQFNPFSSLLSLMLPKGGKRGRSMPGAEPWVNAYAYHGATHLEVKDASIVLYKGLVMRYDSTE